MNTNPHPWLRAALLALIATPVAALAAVQEIPDHHNFRRSTAGV